MTFEQYCVEIENIPFYNFLSKEEYEFLYEKFKEHMIGG